jgi:outer membrane immunogenic protein
MKKVLLATLATAALASSAISSGASAADLAPAPTTYAKAPKVSPATNWSGFYGGANVGYGWGNVDTDLADATPPPSLGNSNILSQSLNGRSSGAIGGGQIGYNWQTGRFVAGLEADVQGSGIKGTATKSPYAVAFTPDVGETLTASSEQRLSWFGTVRGRIGVTITPDLLVYGTGGLAFGEVGNTGNTIDMNGGFPSLSHPAMTSQTQAGWAVGAGAEWMFARGWSAKVEYLHIDLGTASATGGELINGVASSNTERVGYTWHNSFDTVRAGVNYHFN